MSLPLALAQQIARRMGGKLTVRDIQARDLAPGSELAPGTVFSIKIPLKLPEPGVGEAQLREEQKMQISPEETQNHDIHESATHLVRQRQLPQKARKLDG